MGARRGRLRGRGRRVASEPRARPSTREGVAERRSIPLSRYLRPRRDRRRQHRPRRGQHGADGHPGCGRSGPRGLARAGSDGTPRVLESPILASNSTTGRCGSSNASSTEERVWRKVSNYRDERAVEVPWKVSDSETAFTLSYHRTLATYVRYLRAAGLAVVRMEEPLPLPEVVRLSPQGRFLLGIPLHLVVEAIPLRAPGRPAAPRPPLRAPGSRSSVRRSPGAGRQSGSRGRRPGTGSARRAPTTGS